MADHHLVGAATEVRAMPAEMMSMSASASVAAFVLRVVLGVRRGGISRSSMRASTSSGLIDSSSSARAAS